ncbi:MAG: AIM24 family protein, partial [Eubacteriales bacterium]|nr:AIM24 family protein [Eubacteriales bacterium]
MFCPNCGAKNADQARFCGGCGRPLQAAPTPPVQAAPPAQPMPAQPGYGGGPVKPLTYKIFGDNLPAVSIRLDAGESIYTQSGGMTWMDAGIVMETNMKGGLMKGLGRMF